MREKPLKAWAINVAAVVDICQTVWREEAKRSDYPVLLRLRIVAVGSNTCVIQAIWWWNCSDGTCLCWDVWDILVESSLVLSNFSTSTTRVVDDDTRNTKQKKLYIKITTADQMMEDWTVELHDYRTCMMHKDYNFITWFIRHASSIK